MRTVKYVALITFPLFWGIFLVAEDMVYFLLTEKWSPIVLPLKILCIVSSIKAIEA